MDTSHRRQRGRVRKQPGRRVLQQTRKFLRNTHGRGAYCTGCHVMFYKVHHLLNHRYTHRCGGEYRIQDEIRGELHAPIRDVCTPHGYWMAEQKRKDHPVRKHKQRKPGVLRPGRIMNVGHGYCKSRNKWRMKHGDVRAQPETKQRSFW